MRRMQILVTDEQYESLRVLAFQARRSLADVTREAIEKYLKAAGVMRKRWTDYTLRDGDDYEYSFDKPHTRDQYIRAMAEFKKTGGISGFFFEYQGRPHEDSEDASTWGPRSPEEIDWTGFPE